ncbi:MAG: hypothetical protein U1F51_09520 [Burkholderiales bacterium]
MIDDDRCRRRTGARRLAIAVLTATLAALGGCGRPAEAPAVRVDGAYLRIENLTGKDVHVQILPDPPLMAWIPTSLPGNRIEHKRHARIRVPPSVRGRAVVLAWWHPGDPIGNSGIPGPDRVRRIRVPLDPLPDPLPLDEQVVLACIEASGVLKQSDRIEEERERRRVDRKRLDEAGCMEDAEQACFRGNECADRIRYWRHAHDEARRVIDNAPSR